jgi:hypothetical protein
MKLQNFFPEDLTLLGLNNLYDTVGDHSHYINSKSIQTPQKIITQGRDYRIASTSPQDSKVIVHQIKLLDAYYHNGYVHLLVIDKVTDSVYFVDINVECPEKEGECVLFDVTDQSKLKDYIAARTFCEKS